jgi:large subunit ribosomal protein L24
MESPIHVSNVALVDPKTKKATRVGFRVETVTLKDNKTKIVRTRYAKKSGEKL